MRGSSIPLCFDVSDVVQTLCNMRVAGPHRIGVPAGLVLNPPVCWPSGTEGFVSVCIHGASVHSPDRDSRCP